MSEDGKIIGLTVSPLDTAQQGSYLERKRIFALMAQMARGDEAETGTEAAEALEAFNSAEAVVVKYVTLPEGMELNEVLALLSADQFDELLGAILGGAQAPQ